MVCEELKVIEYLADKWCRDNGYPVPKLKQVYNGAWKEIKRRNK